MRNKIIVSAVIILLLTALPITLMAMSAYDNKLQSLDEYMATRCVFYSQADIPCDSRSPLLVSDAFLVLETHIAYLPKGSIPDDIQYLIIDILTGKEISVDLPGVYSRVCELCNIVYWTIRLPNINLHFAI